VGTNVDHLHGVALGLHFFVRLLGPPAAHLVGIPPVVAHELEALVGNVWVIAAIKSQGVKTSKLRPIFLFMPER
jgi:hypothetical protein